MSEFVRVAAVADLPPGERLIVDFDEETVAIFNVDGDYYCIADVCTHDGGPVAEGEIEDHQIECPRHGARFDLRTGAALCLPAVTPVATFQVKVEGGDIYVESPDE
jgi:3-phenylpropionate/trans-cinnamate dioxygenase ferredoxin component